MTTCFILQSIPTIQKDMNSSWPWWHTPVLWAKAGVPSQPQLQGETPSQNKPTAHGEPDALLDSQCLFLVEKVPGDYRNALFGEKEVLKIGVQEYVL